MNFPFARFFKPDNGLDLAGLRAEFEKDYTPEPEVDNPEVDPEPEIDPEPEPEPEPNPEVDPEPEPEPEPEPRKQSREENAAFAQMRKELEQKRQEAELVEKIAANYGMTPDEFRKQYAEQEMAKRAEKEGVPVEILKRLDTLEQSDIEQKRTIARERYLGEVRLVAEKFGLDDKEIESTYKYIGQNKFYDPEMQTPTIPFEQAYKLANFDTLMERKVKESTQKRLADKKARQQSTALPPSNASAATATEDDYSVDDIEKSLKARNLI